MADSRGPAASEGAARARSSSQLSESTTGSRVRASSSGGAPRMKTLTADDLLERLQKATRAFLVAHENDETMHIASRDPPSLRICEVMCEIFQHGLALHHSLFRALRSQESEVHGIFTALWEVIVTAFPQPLIQDIKDLELESARLRCYVWFRKNIGSFGALLSEIATAASAAHAVIEKRYKEDAFLRDMEKVAVAGGFCTMLGAYTFNLSISDLLVRPASPAGAPAFRKHTSSRSRVVKAQAPKDVAPEKTALGKDWSNVAVDTSTVLKVQSPKLKKKKKKKKTTSTREGRSGSSARTGSFSFGSPDVQSPANRRSPTAEGTVFTYSNGAPASKAQDKQATQRGEGVEADAARVPPHAQRASTAGKSKDNERAGKKQQQRRGSPGKGTSRRDSGGDANGEGAGEAATSHAKPHRELSFADSLNAAFEAEQAMLSGKTSPSKQQQGPAEEEGRETGNDDRRQGKQAADKEEKEGEEEEEEGEEEEAKVPQQHERRQGPQQPATHLQQKQQQQRRQEDVRVDKQTEEAGSAPPSAASHSGLCDWMIVQAEGGEQATAYPTTAPTTTKEATAIDETPAVHPAPQNRGDGQQQQQQQPVAREKSAPPDQRQQERRQQRGGSASSSVPSTPRSPGSVSQASIMVHQRPEFAQDDIARDMSHYLFHVGAHIGMCAQAFKCWECNAPISPEGRPFMCRFTGKFFCSNCHHRYRTLVPGRLLHDWDNNHYEVCDKARDYVTRILENNFTFDLREVQPILIEHVPTVQQFMDARKDFYVCFKAMSTCSRAKLSNITYYLGSRPHFMSSPTLVSFKDLDEVKSGKLTKLVTWANGVMRAHTDSCELCQDKILHGTHQLLELEASLDTS